jgi:hypothetical protein
MGDHPIIPLPFEDGLRLLDSRWQFDPNAVVMDDNGELYPMDFAIISIVIGNLLSAANRVTTSFTPVRTEADLTGLPVCYTRLQGNPPKAAVTTRLRGMVSGF